MKRILTESFNIASTNHVDISTILTLTAGADFRVISEGSDTVMKNFIRQFFKDPIFLSSDRTSLGGEHVLSTLYATKAHPDSYHLMYFKGTQDKHYHTGPRLLNIFASEPWSIYLGGTDLSILTRSTIQFAEITFPGNSYTQLRFAAGMIHGFKGKEFAAISTHYTDTEEAASMALSQKDVMTHDVMEKLTTIIDSNKIKIIGPGPILYSTLARLRRVS